MRVSDETERSYQEATDEPFYWQVWQQCDFAKWVYVEGEKLGGIFLVNPLHIEDFKKRHSLT